MKKKEELFKCTVCNAEFSRRFNRDKHVETVHKIPRPDKPPLYPEMLSKNPQNANEEEDSQSPKQIMEMKKSSIVKKIRPEEEEEDHIFEELLADVRKKPVETVVLPPPSPKEVVVDVPMEKLMKENGLKRKLPLLILPQSAKKMKNTGSGEENKEDSSEYEVSHLQMQLRMTVQKIDKK
ncbi:MAG: hypothetical protein GY795_13030 [Desulfobacterales bacterium]|nr:hypothetical protein [Desulfobacterales bacterium]